jgi:23S rRNA (uridine2552-2'-O)-methyltransferase
MSRRARSSGRWRQRQERDPYVERAAREGWRSRAVFKLEEIQRKERILKRGGRCVDLGASPGGWSQYAARAVGPAGRVWAVDVLPMEPISGVEFVQTDFSSEMGQAALQEKLEGVSIDLVMSDMAPNISGQRAVDQPRSIALAEEAMAFAIKVLRPGGDFLVKLFQGEGFEQFVKDARREFRNVRLVKPRASRPESREVYLLARNYGI